MSTRLIGASSVTVLLAGILATGPLAGATHEPIGTPAADPPVIGAPLLQPSIDLVEAQQIALAGQGGAHVAEIDLDGTDGVLAYSIALDNGVDVEVDATTGKIRGTERDEDPDDDTGARQRDNDDDDDDDDDDGAQQRAGGRTASREGASAAPTAKLSATVDHPLVPLTTIPTKLFIGEEVDDETGKRIDLRVEETVMPRTKQVDGIDVAVVAVNDYRNGKLVETTLDYFAQAADGTVHYMGERVDMYKDGKIVGHEGAWLTGDQGTQPGVFMPADPAVGDIFEPERVPGVAEERTTVIAVDQTVTTPAGTFKGCLVAEDAELREGISEQKTYCPEVGLVREDFPGGYLELVEFATAGEQGNPEQRDQEQPVRDQDQREREQGDRDQRDQDQPEREQGEQRGAPRRDIERDR